MTFEEAQELVMSHIRARKWDKTNDSHGLAISLSLEANELLEYFQWGVINISAPKTTWRANWPTSLFMLFNLLRALISISPKRLLQKLPSKPKNIRSRFLRLKTKPSKIAAGWKLRKIIRRIRRYEKEVWYE